jgi:hypothetical protein
MKTEITNGFIVSCMECHGQLGTAIATHDEALREAEIHLSVTEKLHDKHTIAITPTEFVKLKP